MADDTRGGAVEALFVQWVTYVVGSRTVARDRARREDQEEEGRQRKTGLSRLVYSLYIIYVRVANSVEHWPVLLLGLALRDLPQRFDEP